MTNKEKECFVCGSDMEFDGYNGDWGVWICSDDECSSEVQEPVSNPEDDGFTMESLGRVSDYVEEEDS